MPTEAQSLLSAEEKQAIDETSELFISAIVHGFPEKTNRQANWLLLITGGTFAALLSSGLKPPLIWEVKVLIGFLALSSILGVIGWFLGLEGLDDAIMLPLQKQLDLFRERRVKQEQDDPRKINLVMLYAALFVMKKLISAFAGGLPKKTPGTV
jgi:hypothetical protein